jgi:hypothetical protein
VVASRNEQKKYILVVIEYVTKWVEGQSTRTNIAKMVAPFLFEYIIS